MTTTDQQTTTDLAEVADEIRAAALIAAASVVHVGHPVEHHAHVVLRMAGQFEHWLAAASDALALSIRDVALDAACRGVTSDGTAPDLTGWILDTAAAYETYLTGCPQ